MVALLAAGCGSTTTSSSSTPASTPASTPPHRMVTPAASPPTGTETLTAIDTGTTAAEQLNAVGDTPLKFGEGVWAGLVNVTVKPFTLPGSNGDQAETVTFITPAGNVVIHHSANEEPGATGGLPRADWTRTGRECRYTTTWSRGTFTFLRGTGRFEGATSQADSGTFTVTAAGTAPLKAGQSKCGFATTGKVAAAGAEVKFLATGPLTAWPPPLSPSSQRAVAAIVDLRAPRSLHARVRVRRLTPSAARFNGGGDGDPLVVGEHGGQEALGRLAFGQHLFHVAMLRHALPLHVRDTVRPAERNSLNGRYQVQCAARDD